MLAQIAWNGMVSQPGNMKMKSRLASAKTVHTVSITPGGQGQPRRASHGAVSACGIVPASAPGSPGDELITLTPYGLDQLEAQLGAEPPDAHVYHVRAGIEVVAPDGGEQAALGHRLPRVLGEVARQEGLQPGQPRHRQARRRHRARACRCRG